MTSPKSTDITWHHGSIDRAARFERLGQRGCTLWFTGLSGSGKSTVAVALEQALHDRGRHVYRLDGDNVRHGLNNNLGFSPEDRDENIRRIGEVTKLFADSGAICLCSFVSPYRAAREMVRSLHIHDDLAFYEVFVDCPLSVVEQRDPKGLYKKARSGEIKNMTGLDAPFEAPQSPEVHLHTDQKTVEQSVAALIETLERDGVIQ